jgi:hypothetical protein
MSPFQSAGESLVGSADQSKLRKEPFRVGILQVPESTRPQKISGSAAHKLAFSGRSRSPYNNEIEKLPALAH